MTHYLTVSPHPKNPARGYQVSIRDENTSLNDVVIVSGSKEQLEVLRNNKKMLIIAVFKASQREKSVWLRNLGVLLFNQLLRKWKAQNEKVYSNQTHCSTDTFQKTNIRKISTQVDD